MPQITKSKHKTDITQIREKSKPATSKRSDKVPVDNTGYQKVMDRINRLMDEGSEQLTRVQLTELRQLASLAERYEEAHYPVAAISTIAGLIDQKMYDMRLTQRATAHLLGISDAKLSLILNGGQKLDVRVLKAIHQKLDIDANILLDLI